MKFTGGKDTDRYFLESLDDKELFIVMQTNKEYLKLGQDFFKKRMENKYTILASRKPEDVTWFKYYIDSNFYISKLKEGYDLDYYNVPSFYPKTIYHRLYYRDSFLDDSEYEYKISFLIENREYDKAIEYSKDLRKVIFLEKRLCIFLLSQLLKVSKDLFEKMANKYNFFPPYEDEELILIQEASKSGKEEIVDYIISLSNNNNDLIFYTGIEGAIKSGNLNIINYFVKKYPKEEIDWFLSINAIYGENINIFKNFLEKDFLNGKEIFLEDMEKYLIIYIYYQRRKIGFPQACRRNV